MCCKDICRADGDGRSEQHVRCGGTSTSLKTASRKLRDCVHSGTASCFLFSAPHQRIQAQRFLPRPSDIMVLRRTRRGHAPAPRTSTSILSARHYGALHSQPEKQGRWCWGLGSVSPMSRRGHARFERGTVRCSRSPLTFLTRRERVAGRRQEGTLCTFRV